MKAHLCRATIGIAIVGVSIPGMAAGVPGTPMVPDPPWYLTSRDYLAAWTQSTWDQPCHAIEKVAEDLTAGTSATLLDQQVVTWKWHSGDPFGVLGPDPRLGAGLVDGHEYRFRGRAGDAPSINTQDCPTGPITWGAYSDWTRSTLVDLTGPTITSLGFRDEPSGATGTYWTARTTVSVATLAADAVPMGGRASGVATVTVNGGTQTPGVAHALQLGEGTHTVRAQATDQAGNLGLPVVRQVVVDTTRPRIRVLSESSWDAPRNVATTMSATVSDTAPQHAPFTVTWRFGDGQIHKGAKVRTSFARRGVVCGTATTADSAANQGVATFAVRVGSPRSPLGALSARKTSTRVVARACVGRAGWVRFELRRGDGALARTRWAYLRPGITEVALHSSAQPNWRVTAIRGTARRSTVLS